MNKLKKAYQKIKRLVLANHFGYGIFFVCGLILGYILGLNRILSNIRLPHFHISSLTNFSEALSDFLPNINFLTDVIAFEATAFALIIPLTIDILFRISERYDSDVIPKLFMKNIKFHVWVIAISIALNVSLRFKMEEPVPNTIFWKIGAWVIYLSFIFVSWVLVRYLIRFINFASDTKYVKEQLLKDAKKSIR